MICLDCKHAGMKSSPRHTAIGLVPCNAKPQSGAFMSLSWDRECGDYTAAPEAARKARRAWFYKSRGN